MNFTVPTEQLSTLIREITRQVLAETNAMGIEPTRLAWTEEEAAPMLSLQTHQLRDERLRGRIKYSRGPRNRVLYTRQNLLDYLHNRSEEK